MLKTVKDSKKVMKKDLPFEKMISIKIKIMVRIEMEEEIQLQISLINLWEVDLKERIDSKRNNIIICIKDSN